MLSWDWRATDYQESPEVVQLQVVPELSTNKQHFLVGKRS